MREGIMVRGARVLALGMLILTACGAGAPREPAAASRTAATPVDPSGQWEIRWDRGLAGWQPAVFDGTLSLRREDDKWSGSIHFRESSAKPEFSSLTIDGDRFDLVF